MNLHRLSKNKSAQQIAMGCALMLVIIACHGVKKETEHEPVEVVSPTQLHIYGEAMYNIQTSKAVVEDFPDILNVMGRIAPAEDRTTVVPARATGRIDKVTVSSGEAVKAGDILATIVSSDFVTAREEYLQALRQSNSAKGGGDFTNIVKMAHKRLLSMGLNESDITAIGNANSKLEDSAYQLEPSLSLVVRAPRNGALITKNAVIGNQVNLGDTLFTIADLSKVWFLGDLYPEDLQKVHKDQEVIVDPGAGNPSLRGRVSFISPVVDPTARTVKIRVLMDNTKLTLRSDMYVQGGVVLSRKKSLLIPGPSILRDGDANYVFRIKSQDVKDQKLTGLLIDKVKVEIGKEAQGKAVIIAGITDGDTVVSDGALLLNAALANAENSK